MEYHMFIVWGYGGSHLSAIMQNLREEDFFQVYDVFKVEWDKERFNENLSKFYGQSLPKGCAKELEIGRTPFTCIIVRDLNPQYAIRQKKGRSIRVNTNMFDRKILFRSWDGGRNTVHCTNNVAEATEDLEKLLGMDYKKMQLPKTWDGEIRSYKRNVVDPDVGWESIEEMFNVLHETVGYLVLRNFEGLPEEYTVGNHGDIDILVADLKNAVEITGAYHVGNVVHYGVKIKGEEVRFDFRHLGDNYYSQKWEQDLLDRAVKDIPTLTLVGTHEMVEIGGGFMRPNNKDYFYSLLYHAVIQKPDIKADYIPRLIALAKSIGLDGFDKKTLQNRAFLIKFLTTYMESHGYYYVKPSDPTVWYRV
jgi:hypothetical protein